MISLCFSLLSQGSETESVGTGGEVESYEEIQHSTEHTSSLFDHEDAGPIVEIMKAGEAEIESEIMTSEQLQTCHMILKQSKRDVNDMMDNAGYVIFLSDLQSSFDMGGEGSFGLDYDDLAYPLKMNFVHLSCLCPDSDTDCCGEVNGIFVGEGESVAEGENDNRKSPLDNICVQTYKAMDEIA